MDSFTRSGTTRNDEFDSTEVAGALTPPSRVLVAWCAGCREQTEFVAPVGLADAADDELACLQCGWAVLVLRPVPRAAIRDEAA